MKKLIPSTLSIVVFSLSVYAGAPAQTNDEVKKTFSQEWAKMSAEVAQKQQNAGVPMQPADPTQNKVGELQQKEILLDKETTYFSKEEKKAMLKSLPKNPTFEVIPDYITVGGVTNYYIKQSTLDDAKKFFSEIRSLKANIFQVGMQFNSSQMLVNQNQNQQQSYKINDDPVRIHKGMDFGYFTISVLEKNRLIFKEK